MIFKYYNKEFRSKHQKVDNIFMIINSKKLTNNSTSSINKNFIKNTKLIFQIYQSLNNHSKD